MRWLISQEIVGGCVDHRQRELVRHKQSSKLRRHCTGRCLVYWLPCLWHYRVIDRHSVLQPFVPQQVVDSPGCNTPALSIRHLLRLWWLLPRQAWFIQMHQVPERDSTHEITDSGKSDKTLGGP